MRRLMLVANPAASGFTHTLHGDVLRILERGYRVYAPWPDDAEQAMATTAQAAKIGYHTVVAMGGDGIVHAVANALHGSETALAIVPAGTTNVLSRIAGFGNRARDAAEAIVEAGDRVSPLPTLRLDFHGSHGDETRLATFAAGIGFDAEAIEESERRPLKKVGFGTAHYVRSTLRVARRFRDRLANLRVEAGGTSADAVGVMLQVHDDYTFVGRRPMRLGSPPGPMALSVDRVRPLRMIRAGTRALLRRPLDRMPGVHLWRDFDSITVHAEPESLAEADGEVVGAVSRMTATPQPTGLLVVDVR